MLSRVLVYITVVLCVIVVVQRWLLRERTEQVNELATQVVEVRKHEPQTVTVTETEVVTEYPPGKTITRWRVPDGYVRFDIGRYRKAVEELRALNAKLDSLRNLPEKSLSPNDRVASIASNDPAASPAPNDPVASLPQMDSGEGKPLLESQQGASEMLALAREIEQREGMLRRPDSFIRIQRRGLCFKPVVGVAYHGRLSPLLGLKFAFSGRFNFGLAATPAACGLILSRYIDDLLPPVKNTRLGVMVGAWYGGGAVVMGILGVDL